MNNKYQLKGNLIKESTPTESTAVQFHFTGILQKISLKVYSCFRNKRERNESVKIHAGIQF